LRKFEKVYSISARSFALLILLGSSGNLNGSFLVFSSLFCMSARVCKLFKDLPFSSFSQWLLPALVVANDFWCDFKLRFEDFGVELTEVAEFEWRRF